MKNTNPTPKVKYRVFKPLVNLLLFNTTKKPRFETESEELNPEYVHANHFFKNINATDEEFFKEKINIFLSTLNESQRIEIGEMMTSHEMFPILLTLKSFLNDKKEESMEVKAVFKEIEIFVSTGVIGSYFYFFIHFQIESIFDYDFSDTKTISNEQYHNVLKDLCNPKQKPFKLI